MRKSIGLLGLLSVVGCSHAAGDAPSGDTSDVVGVEDIAAVEAAFGLVKDTAGPAGWSRADSKLTAGDCYKEGQAASPKWQFRRYTKGAAFFAPKTGAPGGGDSRALLCIDFDLDGMPTPALSLEGFGLDSAVRYGLGKPLGTGAGMMHIGIEFDHGNLYGQGIDAYCGVRDLAGGQGIGAEPALVAGHDAFTSCMATPGGDADACAQSAQTACVSAAQAEMKTGSLARPSSNGVIVMSVTAASQTFDAKVAGVVERYARKMAGGADVYNMAEDPVGSFVKLDSTDASSGFIEHVRYSRLDAHHSSVNGDDIVVITPKSSDRDPEKNAIVRCEKKATDASFDCEAPGNALAP